MNDPSQSGPTFPFIAGMMNYLGGVSAGRDLLHQAQGQRPDHPPDQRPDPAGADQRPDQPGAGAELGRRSAPRSVTRSIGVTYLNPVTLLPSAIGIDAKAPGGRAGRGGEVHRVRAVTRRARRSCRAATRPVTRFTTRSSRASARCPRCPRWPARTTQTINPYTWGPQEGTDQHLVRRQHRPLIGTVPRPPVGSRPSATEPTAPGRRPAGHLARGRRGGWGMPAVLDPAHLLFILVPCGELTAADFLTPAFRPGQPSGSR